MPRKGQRSQAQKLRWQKQKELVNVSQSGEQVKVSVTAVPRPEVQTSVQTATVSYADVVKRGVCSVSVPKAKVQQVIQTEPQVTLQMQYDVDASGPSHVQVTNSESRPPVISICASRSQASAKYGKYRNKQCMANSLVFLSFLHEDEFITRADLNRVLDKGHAMYSDARKRFVKSAFLACDELPTVVTSRRHEYQVDMSQFARHGTFDGTAHLPSLEQGLHCLDSEFRYALLVMGGNVIAVCKLTNGEYAYFDPHPHHSESVKRVVKRNKDKYEKNSEDIESALEEFEQNRDVVIDEWCNLAPESEVVRLQCDENLPERHSDDENEQENVPDYSRQSDAVTEIRAIREQPAVDPAVSLTSKAPLLQTVFIWTTTPCSNATDMCPTQTFLTWPAEVVVELLCI
ncbi:unnamed protein product [Oreochromis niloticus]|nr:unnamed protein product [Mustela putorius furo]